jgi:hypothetical protein
LWEREKQKRKKESMAATLARRAGRSAAATLWGAARGFASVGSDIVSAAPGVSLQKARSWDEGVATKFSTTPLKDIFYVRSAAPPTPSSMSSPAR